MVRILICWFAILLVANVANSEEEASQAEALIIDQATMIWLERDGIADPNVPNNKVHELLKQGLEHDDAMVSHCALGILFWWIGLTSEGRIKGYPETIDRKLSDLPKRMPGLYDFLVNKWEKGWKQYKEVVPDIIPPDVDAVLNRTACMMVTGNPSETMWAGIPLTLAYLYPGDDKTYDILWKQLSKEEQPGPMLSALYDGKFNNLKDQEYRINVLRNKATIPYWSSIAARSLGEFRSEQGLQTLAQVLEADDMTYGAPIIEIVDAMMKHEEDAAPYISLMRERIKYAHASRPRSREFKDDVMERFVHFEKEFGEQELEVMESPNP